MISISIAANRKNLLQFPLLRLRQGFQLPPPAFLKHQYLPHQPLLPLLWPRLRKQSLLPWLQL